MLMVLTVSIFLRKINNKMTNEWAFWERNH